MPTGNPARLTILGDWGTTRLRLHLCEDGATVPRATVTGPGVKFTDDFPGAFLAHAARLSLPAPLPTDEPIDVVLSGMAGADIGWRDAGYLPCPFDWTAYATAGVRFELERFRVRILPGASYRNEFGYREILRGEEVQASR